MKNSLKAIAAVLALGMLLSGCGSKEGELPDELKDLEVGGAKMVETTTTQATDESEAEPEEESKPESEEKKEIMEFSKSMTAAFCKKITDGDFEMIFDTYDVISAEDTTLYATYTVREHGGVTYIAEEKPSGELTEYYLAPEGEYSIDTVDGEKREPVRIKTNGMVRDLLLGGVPDDARIVAVQEFSDGTLAEKAEFAKGGDTVLFEYSYDRETGELKSVRADNVAVNVSTYTEGTDDIELPVAPEDVEWLER